MTSSKYLRLLVIFMQVQYIIMLLMPSLEHLTHVSIHGESSSYLLMWPIYHSIPIRVHVIHTCTKFRQKTGCIEPKIVHCEIHLKLVHQAIKD